jgi:CRP-like cAMP-binding protein
METARAVFKNNELLRHLDNAALDRIAHMAIRRSYGGNETVYTHGDPGDAVYGVISGQVQISSRTSSHDEVFLGRYGPGRVFGMVSVMDGRPRFVTVRAAPKAGIFVIRREDFLHLLAAYPVLCMSLLNILCRHERLAMRLITDVYAQRSVSARLAHRVLALAAPERGDRDAAEQAVEITQSDLAKYVFVSRQVVNHYLSEWQRRGWVATSRRRVIVTDRQALLNIATNSNGHACG